MGERWPEYLGRIGETPLPDRNAPAPPAEGDLGPEVVDFGPRYRLEVHREPSPTYPSGSILVLADLRYATDGLALVRAFVKGTDRRFVLVDNDDGLVVDITDEAR